MSIKYQYDVAISFAGEDRLIAEEISSNFTQFGINVFYDNYQKAILWGKDLDAYFRDTYGKNTRFVIMLISKNYSRKDWTNFEFDIARSEASRRKEEFILPLRLDNTILLGLKKSIGYIDFQSTNINELTSIMLQKLHKRIPERLKNLLNLDSLRIYNYLALFEPQYKFAIQLEELLGIQIPIFFTEDVLTNLGCIVKGVILFG